MLRNMLSAFGFAALLFAALPAEAEPLPTGPLQLEGKIRQIRGVPSSQAALVTEGGALYPLYSHTPGLAKELKRLSGAKVRLEAERLLPSKTSLLVHSYQILDVGRGVVPRIGHIAALRIKNIKRLVFVDDEGEADLLPVGWGKKIPRKIGAKLWMVGRYERGYFKPTRFSILRPAPKATANK